ncbi:hypothetical protein CP97_14726 [Aurantiacibacter atlanticus]|uniref:Uncharacterized protein n=1 Tax=Aurantiacibacter atlanticus TaxID=1648404 RepID=A0A161I9Z4_9SPHN|nr:hypothetical protein CP97_14726 [Aurantiacibacter atlanticus]
MRFSTPVAPASPEEVGINAKNAGGRNLVSQRGYEPVSS